MHVAHSPEVQKFVEEKVKTGQCRSAEEAVNRILALIREQESLTPDELNELRDDVDRGIAEADRGDFVEFSASEVIAQRHAARARQESNG